MDDRKFVFLKMSAEWRAGLKTTKARQNPKKAKTSKKL